MTTVESLETVARPFFTTGDDITPTNCCRMCFLNFAPGHGSLATTVHQIRSSAVARAALDATLSPFLSTNVSTLTDYLCAAMLYSLTAKDNVSLSLISVTGTLHQPLFP